MNEKIQVDESGKVDSDRRSFLATFTAASVGLLGAVAGVLGVGFLYPIKREPKPALFVCLESEVPADEPLEIKDPIGRKALLMRGAAGDMLVVGTVCSHLGCTVFYRPEKKIFECPCHMGVFDGEGNPVSGPPQVPLERYPVEVRDGKVFVQFS